MYKVKSDKEKNRLYVTLSGFLSAKEVAGIKEEIITEVSKLSPGFDVINDISFFRLGIEETAVILNEIVDFLIEKKVNKVVRIVGSTRSGLLQLSQFTKKSDKYNPQFVPSLEEAEIILKKK